MNVNKKLDRFKQWAGERMGGEVKTNVSDDFKALEIEMGLRQEGMDKMHQSMTNYVKAISKRTEGDKKEKHLPIAQLGTVMAQHADDFEHDSEFGQCLGAFGRTQERLARSQDAYIVAASSSWLESLEKSLVQLKEYQAARRKLEQRRLAYDTSLAKMQKAKREDFRVEEELRSQKLKYEETEEDVYRRMMEIKDAENESIMDLGTLMDAQLEYHEKCYQALIQMKNEWPVAHQQAKSRNTRPTIRSRSNTTRSAVSEQTPVEELPTLQIRTAGHSNRVASSRFADSPVSEYGDNLRARPGFARSTTYDPRTETRRDMSPVEPDRLTRVPSDSLMIQHVRSNLRTPNATAHDRDVFADDSTFYTNNSDMSFGDRSFSSATSPGSASGIPSAMSKKKPPPPPPSRSSKPAPPPPPTKRTLIA